MKNYDMLCQAILKEIGSKDNVSFVTHCMTRLRMNLKDEGLVDMETVKKIPGVLGCQFSGEQFQIIIGPEVSEVYPVFLKSVGMENQEVGGEVEDKAFCWKNIPKRVMDAVIGSVTPIFPIISAAGIIKLLAALLGPSMLGLLPADSDIVVLLTFVGDAGFYYFPVYVAWSAAKKFNTSIPIAMMLGAVMLHPTLVQMVSDGTAFTVFGIPMGLVSYTSQFLPSVLSVWILSYVYRFFDRVSPKFLKIILVPTCSLLVMLPITLCMVGPLGNLIGQGVADGLVWLNGVIGPLAVGLVGALWYFLVAAGFHQALAPIAFQNMAAIGYDSIIAVGAITGTYAVMGLAVAYVLRGPKKDRSIAGANAVTCIVGGISEPTIFSVLLRYRSAMISLFSGGFIGGVVGSLLHANVYFFSSTNFLAGISFGVDLVGGIIACGAAFMTSLIVGIVLGFKKEIGEDTLGETVNLIKKEVVFSPLSGKIIPLDKVKDEAFSSGSLGDGYAVLPESNTVLAPFDGEVVALFPTNHAIGLKSAGGAEVLIHIGIDTVRTKGEGFTSKVAVNEKVKKGQAIIEFDLEGLKGKGYDLTTAILLTSGEAKKLALDTARQGEPLFEARMEDAERGMR